METWQVRPTLCPPEDLVCHWISITCHSQLIGPDSPDQKMSSAPVRLAVSGMLFVKRAKHGVNKMT